MSSLSEGFELSCINSTKWLRRAILGLILLFSIRAVRYLSYATRAITFPFGLDYGEGIVWQQALLIPGSRSSRLSYYTIRRYIIS
jgi:hypothetical protein